jgi:hypothetical protein
VLIRLLPFLLVLGLWIYAFIDCLNTPENEVRKLPKVVWVIIILLFGQVLLGPIAWFLVGRPRRNAPYGAVRANERTWVAPDDNPEFLKSLGQTSAEPSKEDGAVREDPEPSEPSRAEDPDAAHSEEELRKRQQDRDE